MFEEILQDELWIQSGYLASKFIRLKLDSNQFSMAQNSGIIVVWHIIHVEDSDSRISEVDVALLSSEEKESSSDVTSEEGEEVKQSEEEEETSGIESESEQIEVVYIYFCDKLVGASFGNTQR